MRRSTLFPAALALCAALTLGCQSESEDMDAVGTAGVTEEVDGHDDHAGHDHGDEHAHPSEGPHGGELVELGDEEYHAELLHDEAAGTVTVYLLDGAATAAATTDAKELTVNLSHEGERKTFPLAAEPQEGDAEGRSSKFVSSDAALGEELDHGHDDAKLMVKIDGRAFSGTIRHDEASHDVDHSDHDHE
ncbi:hypothetical protein [Alienimonas californiensis]|uniref:Uncharacterized protein n=1 Tax=Alienimonas californiensis TaxID=2527989 RepID=A0A517P8L9_9PLAN|nr:hypothetical protein [Alienimonas californiensis]QDT15717.1 hypothetical protein CA12_18080 [Alienimonas californiensis]